MKARFSVHTRSLADILDDLELRAMRIDDAATELADGDRWPDLAALLAGRVEIALDAVLAILNGQSEERTAQLCRVAGLGLNGYSAVLRMRRRSLKVAMADPVEFLNAYAALTRLAPGEVLRALRGPNEVEPADS